MSSDFVDPYIDPSTGMLRNLVQAATYDELRNAEGEFVALRMSELLSHEPPRFTGSLEDFCYLHKVLFQDIYDWAGTIRTVEIRKNVEGSEFFLPSPNIPMGIAWAREELRKDQFLKDLDADKFASRLAYHYDNYNFVHPFREGNGRVQRLFWTIACHKAGFDLDWRKVSGTQNDEASRLAAEDRRYDALEEMFRQIMTACDPAIPLGEELLASGNLSR